MWDWNDFMVVPETTPLTSLKFLVILSIIHFIVTRTLEIYMSNRPKPIDVRRIQRYNNLLIGIYSAITFLVANILAYRDGRFSSWNRLVCHRPNPTGA